MQLPKVLTLYHMPGITYLIRLQSLYPHFQEGLERCFSTSKLFQLRPLGAVIFTPTQFMECARQRLMGVGRVAPAMDRNMFDGP